VQTFIVNSIGMPHGGLRRPGGNPAPAQEAAEGVAKRVNVDASAAFIPLRDSGKPKIAVEDSHPRGRQHEDGCICR
jgi:hypothetical protein